MYKRIEELFFSQFEIIPKIYIYLFYRFSIGVIIQTLEMSLFNRNLLNQIAVKLINFEI